MLVSTVEEEVQSVKHEFNTILDAVAGNERRGKLKSWQTLC